MTLKRSKEWSEVLFMRETFDWFLKSVKMSLLPTWWVENKNQNIWRSLTFGDLQRSNERSRDTRSMETFLVLIETFEMSYHLQRSESSHMALSPPPVPPPGGEGGQIFFSPHSQFFCTWLHLWKLTEPELYYDLNDRSPYPPHYLIREGNVIFCLELF